MDVIADIAAIVILSLTLGISFYFRSRLKWLERILLWLFCIIYLAVFLFSALDLANPIWVKYANRLAMFFAFIDMIYRVRRRKPIKSEDSERSKY